jgi:hypothetical protein
VERHIDPRRQVQVVLSLLGGQTGNRVGRFLRISSATAWPVFRTAATVTLLWQCGQEGRPSEDDGTARDGSPQVTLRVRRMEWTEYTAKRAADTLPGGDWPNQSGSWNAHPAMLIDPCLSCRLVCLQDDRGAGSGA